MGDALKKIEDYPDVSFIDEISFQKLQAQMIGDFEVRYRELTGMDCTLARADPNKLILDACAVAIYQGYQYSDRAGKMGLLKYSYGSFLDNLAALKGVTRNGAFPASATARFTLSSALSKAAVIPKGTRIRGMELYFETTERGDIQSGGLYTDIPIKCQTAGTTGNGYAPGEIRSLVDPLPYTLKVENITQTGGGANQENDEELAERIFLAPAGYSVAGPESAYAYWVKTFSPSIGECRIVSEAPGEVDIYVMMADGTIPDDETMKGLLDFLEAREVCPLTDHVVIKTPQAVKYDIDLTYYIREADRDAVETINAAVKSACDEYILWQKRTGRDINPSQLVYQVMSAGVKSVEVRKPVFCELADSEIAIAEEPILQYGGLRDD